ncbi:MAG: hypothetical protein V1709_02575 [Planctomycetota bacterium]
MRGSKEFLLTGNADNFYKTSERTDSINGKLCWVHSVYPYRYPQILKIISHDGYDESKTKFKIKPYSEGDERHDPLKISELELETGANFYILKGKKRLAVILGEIECDWYKASDSPEKLALVAPIFSFKDRQDKEFVLKAQFFCFPNLFYLPLSSCGCDAESAIRLEMIQPVPANAIKPYSIKTNYVYLSEVAYELLITHFLRFVGYPNFNKNVADDINTYRDLMISSIVKDSKTNGPDRIGEPKPIYLA